MVKESWLSSYIDGGDNIVVKRADGLSDQFAVRLKLWKHKNILFMAEDMKSGTFKRRIGRLGKKKDCTARAKDRLDTVKIMCKQMGVRLSDRAASRLTVTEAYWLIEKARMLGLRPESLLEREDSLMRAVIDWTPRILSMTVRDIVRRAGCVVIAHRMLQSGETKWRVVQEATRLAPGEVTAMYVAGLYLGEHEQRLKALVNRMETLSKIAEEAPPLVAHVYLEGLTA